MSSRYLYFLSGLNNSNSPLKLIAPFAPNNLLEIGHVNVNYFFDLCRKILKANIQVSEPILQVLIL